MREIIVVLHNLRSLYNVASIFRTADAAGIKKVYLCGTTPSPLDRLKTPRPQFVKISLGAEKYLAWEKRGATDKLLKELKSRDFKIFAVEQAKNSTPYFKFSKFYLLNSRFCLVFGNEVRGLPPSVLKIADKILEIPMLGRKESLNVAVAMGIMAFRLRYPK